MKPCWRGHDRRNSRGDCKECHRINARRIRSGRPTIKRPLYILNLKEFYKIKTPKYIMAELADIPKETLVCWYKGRRHKGDPSYATRERAMAFAQAMRMPFEKMWDSA